MYLLITKYNFLVLLVFTCEIQTSKVSESQRNLLRDYFQKALINDSEKLLTLQQVFLTPRPQFQKGLYFLIFVTVEGRVIDTYFTDDHCYCHQNNSYICKVSMKFELVSPDQDGSVSTIQKFLNEDHIRMVLEVLDPSFYTLARELQPWPRDLYYNGNINYTDYPLEIHFDLKVDKVEIMLQNLVIDTHNALYLTLSWVSLT